MSASCLSIDCDGGTGSQVIADRRDNPFPDLPLPRWGGRHHRNGGRLEIGTVGAITSERWAVSDWNRWAAYVGIRTSDKPGAVHFHYDTHDQLRRHLADFVNAYNFGRRLKTLKGLTPYEAICKTWTIEPKRFTLNPLHQMPRLNTFEHPAVGQGQSDSNRGCRAASRC